MPKSDILIQQYNTNLILKFSKHNPGFLFLLTLRNGQMRLRSLLKFQHPECTHNVTVISHENRRTRIKKTY